MKIATNLFIALLLLSCLVTGCKKEGKLTPSEEKEGVYGDHTLPQGNHPYDADILQLFQKYQTLFLYKYVPHDLYYNINYYLGGVYDPVKDSTTKHGYFDVPAKEAYVGKQLDMLKDIWLKYYPDALLKQALPKQVYLLDSLYYAYNGPGKPLDNWPSFLDFYQGPDYFAVSYGGTYLDNITAAEKYALKSQLHTATLMLARLKGAIKPTAAFAAVTNYSTLVWNNYYPQGALGYWLLDAGKDLDLYMKAIVSNSYAELTAPGGILHPAVDTKGLIKKKYDMVIAYFQSTFGIDLQAIGNAGK
ncbi:hypothetical protein HB364_20910 [Pseudoflavitalea sp. X16]|uniref:hypothetical protein n=1 Tax=Paraflavitalea devenefica TaxID=2716334 RepID=UPI0014238CEB|nr:hypothetical protein [Paraflavitalea devenefica]NII27556.1 hypothetical protein [Paraflavitalea devenefica]